MQEIKAGILKLLCVQNLSIEFRQGLGIKRVLDDLSFRINEGSILALVGESGSGKSLASLAIMGLLPPSARLVSGRVQWRPRSKKPKKNYEPLQSPDRTDEGHVNDYCDELNGGHFPVHQECRVEDGMIDLLKLNGVQRRMVCSTEMSMVFQEPMTALNPVMKCGRQIMERINIVKSHLGDDLRYGMGVEQKLELQELLDEVELTDTNRIIHSYPHQLSGGQRQRLMLAMAMVGTPRLIIADEPTTALDARVQASLLATLDKIVRSRGMGMLLISHDLDVVKRMADEVLVLRKGISMEYNNAREIRNNPKSNYTKALLESGLEPHKKGGLLPVLDDMGNVAVVPKENNSPVRVNVELTWALQIKGLAVRYPVTGLWFRRRIFQTALESIDLGIRLGQTLGLVGESGSGKSTLSRVLVGLQPLWKGEIRLHGQPYHPDRCSPLQRARQVQLVFQDPYSSLNPTQKIGDILAEVVRVHRLRPTEEIPWRVIQLLNSVGLDAEMVGRYPAQLSGGQRQRVVIARALAAEPRILVCDESVSALDVSVRAQILNLLRVLQSTLQLTYLFISHDLSVVYHMSDDIAVLHQGRIVENKPATQLFAQPEHPYTRLLLESMHFGENLSV